MVKECEGSSFTRFTEDFISRNCYKQIFAGIDNEVWDKGEMIFLYDDDGWFFKRKKYLDDGVIFIIFPYCWLISNWIY